MDMLLSLLAAGGAQGSRAFSSIPYVGTGGFISRETGVDAAAGAAALIVQPSTSLGLQAFYDTVRGASARGRFSANEDVASALTFSGKRRIFTGATYNVVSTNYVLWNFARLAGFFDAVVWNGGAASVAHALADTPVAIIAFRRTGAGGFNRPINIYIPGDTGQFANGAGDLEPTVARAWTAVGTTTMDPDNTAPNPVFPAGGTYGAYVFGGGLGRAVVGQYTGDGNPTQDVTLPITASWVLVWRKPTSAFTNHCAGVFDPVIGASVPFMGLASAVPVFSVSGTTLAAGLRANESGVVYRYLAVR